MPDLGQPALPSARLFIGDVNGMPQPIALSGDVTNDNAGAVTVANVGNTATIAVKDANLQIQDDGDTSKVLKFQCSGITTATTRTLTVPDASDTIAVLGLAQTFTALQTITTSSAPNLTLDPNFTGNNTGFIVQSYAGNPGLGFQRAQGTKALPTAVGSGQVIGASAGFGYDGSAYGAGANFRFVTTQAFTTTAHGCAVQLRTCPNGSVTLATTFLADQDGSVFIGANLRLHLDETNLTAARLFTFPDTAGEVEVKAAAQTITALKTFQGGITVNTLGITVTDVDIALGTTTGTKIGTATNQKLGFFNKAPAVQPTDGATLTNNVTSGGSANTIANFTDLVTYANDAATIRNDIYQLALKLKTVVDNLRTLGLES